MDLGSGEDTAPCLAQRRQVLCCAEERPFQVTTRRGHDAMVDSKYLNYALWQIYRPVVNGVIPSTCSMIWEYDDHPLLLSVALKVSS